MSRMRAETRARKLALALESLEKWGWNQSRAATDMGISRETMGQYSRALRAQAPATAPLSKRKDGTNVRYGRLPTPHLGEGRGHYCREFTDACPMCHMERALFLLNRARAKVEDRVFRAEIEEALHRWPLPVRTPDPVAPGDPCPVPEPGILTGSEREDPEPRKKLLTAGSSPAMVPVLETV